MPDFNFSNSLNLEKKTKELAKRCGFPEEVETGINWAYMGKDMDLETILPVMVLLLVIFVSGYLIIYNIFYINVFRDIRHYGLLKTIGMTGRQLRRMVRRQAYILSLYGIPAGLILGAVTGKFILPAVMGSLSYAESTDTEVTLKAWIFIGAAVFSFMTVYISCIRPCRIASAVSPVEAVRYAEGAAVKGKKKQKKTKKVSPQTMAFANLRRNRKKVVIVVASLSLALVLLNSIFSLLRGFDMDKFISARTVSDFSVADATLDNFSISGQERVLDGVTKQFLDFYGEQQPMRTLFDVEKKHEVQMEEWLADYCENVENDLKYTSKSKIVAEFDSVKSMYTMVGGLLALILAVIGILNFINTMVTSILSRKQEFAMMEAVGMTGRQQKQMLCAEGFYYALFTVVAALIIGSLVSVTAIRTVGSGFFFFSWHFTVAPILLCTPFLVLAVFLVPVICYRMMCRQSVVIRMVKAE